MAMTPELAAGKTYIVTGSNGGLGFEAVKHLVSMGAATVVMGVRDLSKGETAKAEIEAETGRQNVIQVWYLDKTSFPSVKAFAERTIEDLDHVDALIDNAGVAQSSPAMPEGHRENMTVNVYSSLLLAVLLMPSMSDFAKRSGTTPHIVLLTSGASFGMGDSWDKVKNDNPLPKMDDPNVFNSLQTYPISKAVQIMATKELARLVPMSWSGVVLNLVDPGICKTNLSRNAPEGFRKGLAELHETIGRTAEEGSRTLLHGAVAGEESHGLVLGSCELTEEQVPAWINGKEAVQYQKVLWEGIAKELERVSPGCVKAIL
ncbi:hypothetical protein NLU13_7559 [Sarocladium strictum]|uniref:Uncharacterized protein n=1 Tax=Sarocladium strictum TaxID=5046 RepID=A0AA39L5B3_SARSR|nr:hypothetical protein NLU13_7559 [Sarocladium strictum]